MASPDQENSPREASSAGRDQARSEDGGLFRHWISAALLLALLAYCVPLIPSADTWWHLKTGQYILQTHTVPHTDPFSTLAAGKAWTAHEWLSDIVFYWIYSLTGAIGLLFLASATLTAAFLFAYFRSGGALPARILALALGVWATSAIFCVRPQIFTYLMVALFLFVLTQFFEKGSYKILLVLPVLTVLWVNFHAAYILGPVIIGLFAAGAVCDWAVGQADFALTKQRVVTLLIVLVACVAVVPLNPNGFAMLAYPFQTLGASGIQTGIMEWRSPDFHLPIFRPFALLLLATVAALALSPRRPRPGQVLLFVFFAFSALYAMRNVPLFALVAFPMLGEYFYLPSWKMPAWSLELKKPLQAATVLLVGVLSAMIAVGHVDTELALEQNRFPARAVSYLESHKLPAPLFNSYDYGGYLIWRLYPQYRVYIDGRTDLYTGPLLDHFLQIYEVNTDPAAALNQEGIRTVLVEPGSNLAGFLRTQKDWNRVYEDPVAVIFSRSSF